MWIAAHVRRLPGEHLTLGCTMGRAQVGRGSVLLGNLGSCLPRYVTLTRSTFLSVVADRIYPLMVFPDGCGLAAG